MSVASMTPGRYLPTTEKGVAGSGREGMAMSG